MAQEWREKEKEEREGERRRRRERDDEEEEIEDEEKGLARQLQFDHEFDEIKENGGMEEGTDTKNSFSCLTKPHEKVILVETHVVRIHRTPLDSLSNYNNIIQYILWFTCVPSVYMPLTFDVCSYKQQCLTCSVLLKERSM